MSLVFANKDWSYICINCTLHKKVEFGFSGRQKSSKFKFSEKIKFRIGVKEKVGRLTVSTHSGEGADDITGRRIHVHLLDI
jgi:hypothetical protein